jgi:hypothetical protein
MYKIIEEIKNHLLNNINVLHCFSNYNFRKKFIIYYFYNFIECIPNDTSIDECNDLYYIWEKEFEDYCKNNNIKEKLNLKMYKFDELLAGKHLEYIKKYDIKYVYYNDKIF